jgi:uncharacterized membrane protein
MEYLALKSIHILSAILLFGTGLGSAFYKYFTDRSGNLEAIVETNRLVVRADWLFTTPTIIIQPVTGFAMMQYAHWSLDTPWLLAAGGLYLLAGACWLPVVWLQIRMRDISRSALRHDQPLPETYRRMARRWFLLGIPAFTAMVLTVLLMVFKPNL